MCGRYILTLPVVSCSNRWQCLKEGDLILAHFLPLGNGLKTGDSYLLDNAPDFIAELLKVKLFSCGLSMPSCQHFLNLGAESAVVSFPLLRFFVLQCLLFRCRAGMCACKNTNIFNFFFPWKKCDVCGFLSSPSHFRAAWDCKIAVWPNRRDFKVPILQSKVKQWAVIAG